MEIPLSSTSPPGSRWRLVSGLFNHPQAGWEVGERGGPIPEGLAALVWPGPAAAASPSFHLPCCSPVFPGAKDPHPVPSPAQVSRRGRQKDQGNSQSPDNTLEPVTSMEMKSTYLLT